MKVGVEITEDRESEKRGRKEIEGIIDKGNKGKEMMKKEEGRIWCEGEYVVGNKGVEGRV